MLYFGAADAATTSQPMTPITAAKTRISSMLARTGLPTRDGGQEQGASGVEDYLRRWGLPLRLRRSP
jgi:hypothetical protein